MRRRLLALLCSGLLVACGDDSGQNPTPIPEPTPDVGGDLDAGMDADVPDFVDVCEGVTCSGKGSCVVGVDDVAECVCQAGFGPTDGPDCVPGNAPPAFSNLPGGISVRPIADGSFQVEAADPEGGSVTFARDSSRCSFEVAVSAAGLVTFTCPVEPEVCGVVVSATDDALEPATARAELSIGCSNEVPRFRSAPPPSRLEGEDADYAVSCIDPEGEDTTITVAPEDTCGGAIEIVGSTPTYRRAFGEDDGGSFCKLAIVCSDGVDSTAQEIELEIIELNDPPTFDALPATHTSHWGESSVYTATATDGDLPAQTLTWSLDSHDCAEAIPQVAPDGAISLACGDPESCDVVVSVTDDFLPPGVSTETLTLECANSLPVVSDVAISPGRAEPGDVLTCTYTFADADADADESTFQWFANGNPIPLATTAQLGAGFGAADEVVCRVTPADGSGQLGAPVEALVNVLGARPLLDLGSVPGGRITYDGALHFGAADLGGDRYLWRTDGTRAGSLPIAQVNAAPMGVVGTDLILSAEVDPAIGRELYRLDPQGGITLLADLNPSSSSNPSSQGVVDGVLYFRAFSPGAGLELYATDGSPAGTQLLVDAWAGVEPGSGSSPARVGNVTVFHSITGFGPDAGSYLYATDGTAAATTLVETIGPATNAGITGAFASLGSSLYFTASSPLTGREIWTTDGVTAAVALDHVAGASSGVAAASPVAFGSLVYFVGADGDLWSYDPATMAPAVRAVDLDVAAGDQVRELVTTPLGLYFYANDGVTGAEVYRLPSSGAPVMLADATAGTSNLTGRIMPLSEGGVAYEVTHPTGAESIWLSTDGTAASAFEAFSDTSQDDVTLLTSAPGAFYFFTRFGPNYKLYVYYY